MDGGSEGEEVVHDALDGGVEELREQLPVPRPAHLRGDDPASDKLLREDDGTTVAREARHRLARHVVAEEPHCVVVCHARESLRERLLLTPVAVGAVDRKADVHNITLSGDALLAQTADTWDMSYTPINTIRVNGTLFVMSERTFNDVCEGARLAQAEATAKDVRNSVEAPTMWGEEIDPRLGRI